MELIGKNKVLLLDSRPDSLALVKEIALAKTSNKNDGSFVLFNLDTLYERFELWKRELPMFEPFYAFKCNPDTVFVRTLAALGVGFDCASKQEIEYCLKIGVSPDRIIYANPCKTPSFVSYAQEQDIKMMTFDNDTELIKVHQLYPDAEMILRIAVADPTASIQLCLKFGAEPVNEAAKLLKMAKTMGVNVVGISFHVGSGCNDPSAYRRAISHAKDLCEIGTGLGFDMKILDIGGGFPGAQHMASFEGMADVIRGAMNDFFPDTKMRLIAEPGRYFAQAPSTLVVNVIHTKEVSASRITKNAEDTGKGMMYYLNEGAYGYFSIVFFDPWKLSLRPLFEGTDETLYPSTIWGPTCDSLDLVAENTMIRKLEIGDWLVQENMGAYASACSTRFNSFTPPVPIYAISTSVWEKIKTSAHI